MVWGLRFSIIFESAVYAYSPLMTSGSDSKLARGSKTKFTGRSRGLTGNGCCAAYVTSPKSRVSFGEEHLGWNETDYGFEPAGDNLVLGR